LEPSKKKKLTRAAAAAKASSSYRSSGDSSGSDVEVVYPPTLSAAELMPAELGYGPAFDSVVAAGCARRWIATDLMEQGIPAGYLSSLFRARLWTSKERDTYDKMIRRVVAAVVTAAGRTRSGSRSHTACRLSSPLTRT
jgi:hypothetical protein